MVARAIISSGAATALRVALLATAALALPTGCSGRDGWTNEGTVTSTQAGVRAAITESASQADEPMHPLWRKYPHLKADLDADRTRMEQWLVTLEADAFEQKHPALARQALDGEPGARIRALSAVAALRERPALPILVKATTAKDVTVRRAAFWLLSKWIYDTYHADREACASLGAMLPVFIDALAWIRDDSLPNIRSNCFQAIGCLAGPEWIDFVADLGRSRHGAVEHWASWALGQLRSRQPPTQPQPASP